MAFVAGAVVGHDPRHGDAQRLVVGDGGMKEGDGAFLLLVGQDLAAGDARGIVDADVNELPADTPAVRLAVTDDGDAVADAFEEAEIPAVGVDQFAGETGTAASRGK